jgi:hypothetical protein
MKRCLAICVAVLGFAASPAFAVNHPFIPANEASDNPMAGGNNAVACQVGKSCPKSAPADDPTQGRAQGEEHASFTREDE